MIHQKKRFAKYQISSKPQAQGKTTQQVLFLRTHMQSENTSDLILSPDIMPAAVNGSVVFVTQHKTGNQYKFACQVTKQQFFPPGTCSILKPIFELYGIQYIQLGHKVKCTLKTKAQLGFQIEVLQVTIKQNYFSRRDQYKFINWQRGQAVYVGKMITFGGVKLTVTGISNKNTSQKNGIVTSSTITIFRSQCAHLMLLIQISQQLFIYSEGQLGWQRLKRFLNVFMLRNTFLQNSHKIQAFLFARLEYPQFKSINQAYNFVITKKKKQDNFGQKIAFAFQISITGVVYQDVIRKIQFTNKKIDSWNSLANLIWIKILQMLANFNWQINKPNLDFQTLYQTQFQQKFYSPFKMVIPCRVSNSKNSNLLQSIITTSQITLRNNLDRSLIQTGLVMTILTCGNGQYSASKSNYISAKHAILNNNILCCLIALNKCISKQLKFRVHRASNIYKNSKKLPLIYQCLQQYCYKTQMHYQNNELSNEQFFNNLGLNLQTATQLNDQLLKQVFHINKIQLNCKHQSHLYVTYNTKDLCKINTKSPHWIDFTCMSQPSKFKSHLALYDKFPNQTRLKLDCPQYNDKYIKISLKQQKLKFDVIQELQKLVEESIKGKDVSDKIATLQYGGIRRNTQRKSSLIRFQATEQNINIFQKQKYQRDQMNKSRTQIKHQSIKHTKFKSQFKCKWQMIKKQNNVHRFMLQYSQQTKNKFKSTFLGAKDNILRQLFQIQYYWKLILLPILVPLYTPFFQQSKNHMQPYSIAPPQDMTFQQCKQQLIALRMASNFQIVDFKNVVDSHGNIKPRIQMNQKIIMIKHKAQHKINFENKPNINIDLAHNSNHLDLYLRYLIFQQHDNRCVSSQYYFGHQKPSRWSILDKYLLHYQADLIDTKQHSKNISFHFFFQKTQQLRSCLNALNDKFSKVQKFELLIQQRKANKILQQKTHKAFQKKIKIPLRQIVKGVQKEYQKDCCYLLYNRCCVPGHLWTIQLLWIACGSYYLNQIVKIFFNVISQQKKSSLNCYRLPILKILSLINTNNQFLDIHAQICFQRKQTAIHFEETLKLNGFHYYKGILLSKQGTCGLVVLVQKKLCLFLEWQSIKLVQQIKQTSKAQGSIIVTLPTIKHNFSYLKLYIEMQEQKSIKLTHTRKQQIFY